MENEQFGIMKLQKKLSAALDHFKRLTETERAIEKL